MKKRKRKGDDAAEAMFSEPPPTVPRITPEDIQQKEFGVARMGGYRHHEVDEFLDELTRAMGDLIEENERLRDAAAGAASPPPAAGAATPGGASRSGAAGVQPFLERERDFLRALGELVQEHMEQVRAMAKRGSAQDEPASAAPEPASPRPPAPIEEKTSHEAPAASEPAVAAPAAAPPTEPINVAGSEPAVAGRGEEGGLRELFWGEDD